MLGVLADGGNRANGYQNEESEMWVGEWMAKRGVRDEMVVATKYTSPFKGNGDGKMRSNYGGNSAKSMHVSVEASLKKLQTDYIDLVRHLDPLDPHLQRPPHTD